MKFMKAIFVAVLAGGILGQTAMANTLSGYYRVKCLNGEVLQSGTVEKIEAQANSFAQSLDMQGQQGAGPRFSPLLTTTIGDVIKRPTPDIVKLGYTSVDRQISSYSTNKDEFTFREYVYDMNISDAAGLAAGPYKTITIKALDRELTYDLQYNDGEQYLCILSLEY